MNKGTDTPWQTGRNGMQKTLVQSKNGASAEIYQQGAHLTSWTTLRGKQWLFLSAQSKFETGTAIRGGVPVIFPQFNAFGSGQRHGFARNLDWQIKSQSGNELILQLDNNDATQSWPHPFHTELRVVVGDSSLQIQLKVSNTGDESCQFTCALHSYFAIDHLSTTFVSGLDNLHYWDNDGSPFSQRRRFTGSSLSIADAIDRVFFNYQKPLVLTTASESLQLEHIGFEDIVIWNPGAKAAKNMSDFGDSEYNAMLCIEAAQIDRPIILEPGETWQASQNLTEIK